MKIKKMVGEVFELPVVLDISPMEGVETVNETTSKRYYRFKKAGSYSYSIDDITLDFEIYSRDNQVTVTFPEKIFLSQGALIKLEFPRKVNSCRVKCNEELVFTVNKILLDNISFRVYSHQLSEENTLKISYDGLPWEVHKKKTSFITKDASKALFHDGRKIVIDWTNLIPADCVLVDNIEFTGTEINKIGATVKICREGTVIAYMVV